MYSIMLVEDEKWVRTALRRTIEKVSLPFSVARECENGLEALDWLRGNSVDLILTDIRMPVMDGLAFLRELRRDRDDLDVIIISVHDDFHFIQQALREGVADYLLKPVELPEMAACLEKWLERRNRRAAMQAERIARAERFDAAAGHISPIERVLQYIRTTPPGQVTLVEAAQKVHLNPSYLSQLFKQQMNINFVDYLTDLRMKEAKKLLAATSLRISEIADRLGYADVAYFSNAFKKAAGCTPSEFRAKNSGRSPI